MKPGVRARWRLAEIEESDPFGAVVYSTGVTLDLTASEEGLATQIVDLLWLEGKLAARGMTCALKDAGQDCLTCTEATLDPADSRSRLCRLGKDQVTVEALFNEARDARLGPVEELALGVEEFSELGVLPFELADLLTEVRP